MQYFATEYPLKDQQFSQFIYAPSQDVAVSYASLRNIGEQVLGVLDLRHGMDPSPLPSTFYKKRQLTKCMHTLTFYSYIAVQCGAIRDVCKELLDDFGLLHEVSHEAQNMKLFPFRDEVHLRLITLEEMIPGLKSYKACQPPAHEVRYAQ